MIGTWMVVRCRVGAAHPHVRRSSALALLPCAKLAAEKPSRRAVRLDGAAQSRCSDKAGQLLASHHCHGGRRAERSRDCWKILADQAVDARPQRIRPLVTGDLELPCRLALDEFEWRDEKQIGPATDKERRSVGRTDAGCAKLPNSQYTARHRSPQSAD